jgi:AraC family transcriptional regulator
LPPCDIAEQCDVVAGASTSNARKKRKAGTRAIQGPTLAAWQIEQAEALMSEELARPLQVATVAARFGMSPTHFSKAFKTMSGITPYGWHLRRRIVRSASLLRDEALTLANIAQACGFSDQSHYTKAFRRHLGITPGRWRRKLTSGDYPWVKR